MKTAQANPNPVDRWGSTPLNGARSNIVGTLKQYGAILGTSQPPYAPISITFTKKDQFRLYYAAFYGDVQMMENLSVIGWDIKCRDYDGRTALAVAASQGNLEAVKYLIA